MSNSISTINSPIYFFQDLIRYKSLGTMIISFKDNSPFDDFDSENLIAIDYERDEYGNYIKLENKFAQFLLKVLKRESLISIKLIDQSLRRNLEETVSLIKIKNILDILYTLNKGIPQSLPSKIQNIIHQSLINIIKHIFHEYSILGITHPCRYLIQDNKSNDFSFSFFGAVRENFKFYKDLHAILYDNNIIPESEEDDDLFFKLLISEKPHTLGAFIKFSKSNRDVAFILKALFPFFKNFNFRTIGESQCFLNKGKKIFNENDLQNALSESIKYYNDNPHRRRNHEIQEVYDWINAQKSSYLIYNT